MFNPVFFARTAAAFHEPVTHSKCGSLVHVTLAAASLAATQSQVVMPQQIIADSFSIHAKSRIVILKILCDIAFHSNSPSVW